jgi:enoyl-CoA hydratase/carnithine racemase
VAPVSEALTKIVGRKALEEVDQKKVAAWQKELFRWSGKQPDAVEGVRAFLDRRAPEWKLSKSKDLPTELMP